MEIQFGQGQGGKGSWLSAPVWPVQLSVPRGLCRSQPLSEASQRQDRICLGADEVRQCLAQAGPDVV